MLKQTETKEMKRALVAEFGHPFSVRRDRGTASHWVQIRVLDHVILGDSTYFSFGDEGLMADYEMAMTSKKFNN